MCGIFAYAGTAPPDPDLLEAAATAAAARGPHGHGWATSSGASRGLGSLPAQQIRMVGEQAVIGHARLATTGDYRDPAGLQPITADGHHLVHNGTVRNWRSLAPDGEAASDSVVLAHLYARHRRRDLDPPHALAAALADADTDAWALTVLDADHSLVFWRRRLPIWELRTPDGLYLSSRRFHSDCHLVPDGPLHLERP